MSEIGQGDVTTGNAEAPVKTAKQLEKEAKKAEKLAKLLEKQKKLAEKKATEPTEKEVSFELERDFSVEFIRISSGNILTLILKFSVIHRKLIVIYFCDIIY